VAITDNAPGSPQIVSLTGTGTEVTLVPSSLTFGSVPIGQTASLQTVLTNVGNTAMTITAITIVGTDAGDFSETYNCGKTLGAGKSCTITVTFIPQAVGLLNADVSVSDNGGASPQFVSLSGVGACGGNCITGCVGAGCRCIVGRCLASGPSDLLNKSQYEPGGAWSERCEK
jgi:hypothetical protein